MAEQRDRLTELDAAIGDADHGANMHRGMSAVVEALAATPAEDPAALLKQTGMVLIRSVGGASGPLYGTLFLRMAPVAGTATLEPETFAKLGDMGWRRVVMPAGRYKGLEGDHACIDYSAWPLYARTDLPEEIAYRIVDAIHAREAEIVWENFNQWAPYQGIGALGEETDATPRDVPLHPGAARWFREHGFKV